MINEKSKIISIKNRYTKKDKDNNLQHISQYSLLFRDPFGVDGE